MKRAGAAVQGRNLRGGGEWKEAQTCLRKRGGDPVGAGFRWPADWKKGAPVLPRQLSLGQFAFFRILRLTGEEKNRRGQVSPFWSLEFTQTRSGLG